MVKRHMWSDSKLERDTKDKRPNHFFLNLFTTSIEKTSRKRAFHDNHLDFSLSQTSHAPWFKIRIIISPWIIPDTVVNMMVVVSTLSHHCFLGILAFIFYDNDHSNLTLQVGRRQRSSCEHRNARLLAYEIRFKCILIMILIMTLIVPTVRNKLFGS